MPVCNCPPNSCADCTNEVCCHDIPDEVTEEQEKESENHGGKDNNKK